MHLLANPLHDYVQHRDREDTHKERAQHVAKDRGTDHALIRLAGTAGDRNGHQAEDEGEAGRKHAPDTQPPCIGGGLQDGATLPPLIHGELDDQDSVRARQTDEHNDPDLGIEVVG